MSRWAWHPGAWGRCRGVGGWRGLLACQLTWARTWFQGPQLLSEIWGLQGKWLVRDYPDLPEAPVGAWVSSCRERPWLGGGEEPGGYGAGDRLGDRLSGRQEPVMASCRRAGGARYHVIDRSGRGEGSKHPVVKLPPRQGLEKDSVRKAEV